jgi:ribosomal-protein-alanine N-acetyltransferase
VILGYDLARVYWGNGFATEGVTAVLNFAFSQMNLNRVDVCTIADNHGSVRMLERLGFVREGTRRGYSWEDDGTFHDSAIYGLLKAEWGNDVL